MRKYYIDKNQNVLLYDTEIGFLHYNRNGYLSLCHKNFSKNEILLELSKIEFDIMTLPYRLLNALRENVYDTINKMCIKYKEEYPKYAISACSDYIYRLVGNRYNVYSLNDLINKSENINKKYCLGIGLKGIDEASFNKLFSLRKQMVLLLDKAKRFSKTKCNEHILNTVS